MDSLLSHQSDGRSNHVPYTRAALVDAALSLFASKGYESTSIDEIAEQVGVSPRTFYRYFETKDRVLFFGGDAFNDAVVRHLPEQPYALGDLEALAATFISLAPMVTPLKERIRLFNQALLGSPALMGQQEMAMLKHNAAVAEGLARRRGLSAADPASQMVAGLASVVLRQTYAMWLSSSGQLLHVMTANFALLREVSGEAN